MSNALTHTNKSNWRVVYTRSRAEKKVAEKLLAMGVEAYCPTCSEVRQWSDRKKTIQKPALPSMVLVREGYPDQQLFSCSGVVGFMSYKGKRAVVTQHEVDVLDNVLQGKYSLGEHSITIGDRIEVPVLKQAGRVVKIKGNACWVELVNTGLSTRFTLG